MKISARKITYVALLRGINVGGNNKVDMKTLKQCFEGLGFEKVSTYINSGNVIFQHSGYSRTELAAEIETAIKKQFKLSIKIVLRTKDEMKVLCQKIPANWTNDESLRTDILFLWEAVDNKQVLSEIEINPEVDKLIYAKGAVIWNIDRAKYTRSKLNKFIGTYIYKNMTARNVNTVRKLYELMDAI